MLPEAIKTPTSNRHLEHQISQPAINFLKCDSLMSKCSGIVQLVFAQPLSFSTWSQLPGFSVLLIIRCVRVQCEELQQKVIHFYLSLQTPSKMK